MPSLVEENFVEEHAFLQDELGGILDVLKASLNSEEHPEPGKALDQKVQGESEAKLKKSFEKAKIKLINALHKSLAEIGARIGELDAGKYKKYSDEERFVDVFNQLAEVYQLLVYANFELTDKALEELKKMSEQGESFSFMKLISDREMVKISCKQYDQPKDGVEEGGAGNINSIKFAREKKKVLNKNKNGEEEIETNVVIKGDPFTVYGRKDAAGRQDKEQGKKNIADNPSVQLFQQTIEKMMFGSNRYIAETEIIRVGVWNKESNKYDYHWETKMENVQDKNKGQKQGAQCLFYVTNSEKIEIEGYLADKTKKSKRNINYGKIYQSKKISAGFILQTLDIGLLDFIAGQRDRHSGNYTIDTNGNVKLFDNDRILGLDMSERDYKQMLNEKMPIVTSRTALQMILLVRNYAKNRDLLNIQCGFNQFDEYGKNKIHKSKALIETEKRIVLAYNHIFGTKFKLQDLSMKDLDKSLVVKNANELYNGLKEYLENDCVKPVGESVVRDGGGKLGGQYKFEDNYRMSEKEFDKFVKDCLKIPKYDDKSDKDRFSLLTGYLKSENSKTKIINDYELVSGCEKSEDKLKGYADKFLRPEHVSIISKIFAFFGWIFDALRTTKKANLISASHVNTRLPLMKYKKPKTDKQLEKSVVKEMSKNKSAKEAKKMGSLKEKYCKEGKENSSFNSFNIDNDSNGGKAILKDKDMEKPS